MEGFGQNWLIRGLLLHAAVLIAKLSVDRSISRLQAATIRPVAVGTVCRRFGVEAVKQGNMWLSRSSSPCAEAVTKLFWVKRRTIDLHALGPDHAAAMWGSRHLRHPRHLNISNRYPRIPVEGSLLLSTHLD